MSYEITNYADFPTEIINRCACSVKEVENSMSIGVYKVSFFFIVSFSAIIYFFGGFQYGFERKRMTEFFLLSEWEYSVMTLVSLAGSIPMQLLVIPMADEYGRNLVYIIVLLLMFVGLLLTYFSVEKIQFMTGSIIIKTMITSIHTIDILFLQEKIRDNLRNTALMLMFLLECFGMLFITMVNQVYQTWHHGFLVVIILGTVCLISRLFIVESYLWQNRVNRPHEACHGMNYVAAVQREDFKVIWASLDLLSQHGKSVTELSDLEQMWHNPNGQTIKMQTLNDPMYRGEIINENENSNSNEEQINMNLANTPYISVYRAEYNKNTYSSQNGQETESNDENYTYFDKIKFIFTTENEFYHPMVLIIVFSLFYWVYDQVTLNYLPTYMVGIDLMTLEEQEYFTTLATVNLTVLMAGSVFFAKYINPLIAIICAVAFNILSTFVLLFNEWKPEYVYCVVMSLILWMGRMFSVMLSIVIANVSFTEYRATTFTMIKIIRSMSTMLLVLMVEYIWEYDEFWALIVSVLLIVPSLVVIIIYMITYGSELKDLPH